MILHRIAAASALLAASAQSGHAEPRLRDVLAAVTLPFGDDGGLDRAILVRGDDSSADLYVYRSASDDKPGAAGPDFLKKNVVFAGSMAGTIPSLGVNDKGSLLITSTNFGVGRVKWTQTLTVVFRKAEYLIAGITYSAQDTLDPKGGGSCDLNLLAGKGTRSGKPVSEKLSPIKLADWSDEKLPQACQF